LKVGRFDDAKRCPFSLGRAKGRTGCKVDTAVDMELRYGLKVSGFAEDLRVREGFPVDIELKPEKGLEVDGFDALVIRDIELKEGSKGSPILPKNVKTFLSLKIEKSRHEIMNMMPQVY
jgi:hypothetical protein